MKKLIPIILFCAVAAQADITIFDSNTTISGAYDVIVIKGPNTVVTMNGGTVNRAITMDGVVFNVSGGSINGAATDDGILSYDTSIINLTGGTVKRVSVCDSSRLNISSDANITDKVQTYDVGDVNMCGGTVEEIELCSCNVLNMSGGTIADRIFVANESFICRLSGGTIPKICGAGNAYTNVEVGIIGYGLSKVPYGGSFGCGQVAGNWNDDSPFVIDFQSIRVYPLVVLYDEVIPAACESRPLGDLTGDCAVDFEDFAMMASDWLD